MRTNFTTMGNRAVCKGLIKRKCALEREPRERRKKDSGRKSSREKDRTVKFRGGRMVFIDSISLFSRIGRREAWSPTESAFRKTNAFATDF